MKNYISIKSSSGGHLGRDKRKKSPKTISWLKVFWIDHDVPISCVFLLAWNEISNHSKDIRVLKIMRRICGEAHIACRRSNSKYFETPETRRDLSKTTTWCRGVFLPYNHDIVLIICNSNMKTQIGCHNTNSINYVSFNDIILRLQFSSLLSI